MAGQEKTYPRFSVSQRAQHWVMTLSFVVLAVTGLPQRYALADWAEWMIAVMGGIETVRIIHRAAAVIFILVTVFHFIALAYAVFVKRVRMSILPGLKDVTDMLDAIRYNLGLAVQHPRLPRFSFAEKIEYWSLIWGSVLMILTGFMLWNPIATTSFLPGEFIPAAKAAHSAEALLAVLAVVIWHFYAVHVKTFNRSMFTGKLTRKEMEAEHAAELDEIEAGLKTPPVPREVKRRRERIFLPVATVVSLVAAFGLFNFLTFEQTAITTVPPAETVQAFLPATPTPTNTPTITPTPTQTPIPTLVVEGGMATPTPSQQVLLSLMLIPHPIEGREDCLLCHAQGAMVPFPADHVGRPSTTCLVCHATTEAAERLPAPVKHDLEGRENCLMCHAVDLLPESHKTAAFSNSDCLLCHTPGDDAAAASSGGQPATEAGSAGTISFADQVLPLLEANCTATCHGAMGLGGLKLTDYASLMAGGQSGPAVIAGSPEESLIITTMQGEHAAVLSESDLQTLVDWIAAGAEDN